MKNKGIRLIILSLLTIGWVILMRKMTAPLDPLTMIRFEFIGSADKASELLGRLKDLGQSELLTRSIFLDFIFPFFYGATMYYASAWICSKLPSKHPLNRFQLLGTVIITAVVCDLIENVSLLKLIYYPASDLIAYSAFFFAGLKFVLIFLVLLHFITCLLLIPKVRKAT